MHTTILLLCIVTLNTQASETRIALVIGNGNYSDMSTLSNATNDAQDMKAALKKLGFEVISGINLNKKNMNAKIREFDLKLRSGNSKDTIGLFYYAGHGLEVDGKNYLVPTDAQMDYQEDAQTEGIQLNRVLNRMNYSNSRMKIVILDACRNNPLPKQNRSANTGWSALNNVANGMFIAYGTAPGRLASDNSGNGRNGLFTKHILRNINTRGKTIGQIFNATRAGVLRDSQGKQTTWQNSAITGDFYFVPQQYQSIRNTVQNTIQNASHYSLIIAKEYNEKGRNAYNSKNYIDAYNWFFKAAEKNYANAQYNLGLMYQYAYSVTKNYTEAVRWYRKAAEQNFANAQYKLGYMYQYGHSVTKNYTEAIRWYRKAAEQNYASAQSELGYMYHNGYGVTKNHTEAVRWYRKAAGQNYARAQYLLGFMYEFGQGVTRNYSEASKWYNKAVKQNNKNAKKQLISLNQKIRVGKTFKDCGDCPTMVYIPAGTFQMGSKYSDEKPLHKVIISSFAMGQSEVTFKQWDACYHARACKRKAKDKGWGRGLRPVINVSWNDAQEYVKWLQKKTGKNYRLPSESEWEYSALAGGNTRYSWGNTISCHQARYGISLGLGYRSPCGKNKSTVPVKSYASNPFGLFDMHGNVSEWMQDCWHENYIGAPTNGKDWSDRDSCTGPTHPWRSVRGGSWNNGPMSLYAKDRSWMGGSVRDKTVGFRMALDI
ncbi:MAG: SUMF1/EgtB/PvdO family nonheme iron enzyme [Alcanivoracaceae bacterium]|nr:SUMF1/EgtB/PvdO family nonheme iron enzyme [Alcanivoracaceae bacterium]